MIRLPDNSEVKKPLLTTLILSGLALFVIRVSIWCLWIWFGSHPETASALVVYGSGIVSVLILIAVCSVTVLYFSNSAVKAISYDIIASAVTTYAVSTLALLLFAAIVPMGVSQGQPTDILGVITSNLVALGVFSITFGIAGFYATFTLRRQHRSTRRYLLGLALVVVSVWACAVLGKIWGFFDIAGIVLVFFGSVVTLINVRRLNWLATIGMDKKIRLLWLALCGAFASLVLSVFLALFDDSYVFASTKTFFYGGTALCAAINAFAFVFFVRLFFATVASLPNSGIVDRRSSEVDALSAMTKLVAESASTAQLLTSVTRHARHVCGAHGAWCELYSEAGMQVFGEQLVSPEFVKLIHNRKDYHDIIAAHSKPQKIDSLQSIVEPVAQLSALRSLICVPIVNKGQRAGTLVMFSTIEYGFEEDDLRLLSAFGDTIGVSLDQARLVETAVEKERLQKEFEVAREIQLSLLPRTSPQVPGCSVHSLTLPATQVGGDYYDYFMFPDGSFGFVIADVSGKGVPAALYMATLKGVVLAESRNSQTPKDLLTRINATLYGSMERHTYITMMCVQFNPKTNVVTVARAGHTPALFRIGGEVSHILPAGVAIGILPPSQFEQHVEQQCVSVGEGDVCLLTTDGVNERRNEHLAELTYEPLTSMMQSTSLENATDLVTATMDVLAKHAGTAEQHDDITIVGILFSENETSADSKRSPSRTLLGAQ